VALIVLVLMPFWVSLLSRTFAWVGLLQDTGLINSFLQLAGLIDDPIPLIRTPLGVLIGMVHILLPYMVLPLMNTMADIDKGQLQAARSLGATPLQRFIRVFLPLSRPGIFAGFVLVFVLSLGFYITPAMLGAPQNMMIGELLIQETQKVGLVRASALGIILLAGTLISFGLLATMWKMSSGKAKP
jgi:putative spermidine/putrescine transport system permease protein